MIHDVSYTGAAVFAALSDHRDGMLSYCLIVYISILIKSLKQSFYFNLEENLVNFSRPCFDLQFKNFFLCKIILKHITSNIKYVDLYKASLNKILLWRYQAER